MFMLAAIVVTHQVAVRGKKNAFAKDLRSHSVRGGALTCPARKISARFARRGWVDGLARPRYLRIQSLLLAPRADLHSQVMVAPS